MTENPNTPSKANGGLTDGALMSPEQRLALIQSRARARREQGDGPTRAPRGAAYIKIDGNNGTATYGADMTPFPVGDEFVVDPEQTMYGVINWQGKKPVEKRLMGILEGAKPPAPHGEALRGTLPKPRERDGWADVYSIPLAGTQGDLKGVILRLDCNNDSSYRRASDLAVEMIDRIALSSEDPDAVGGRVYPIVKVTVGSYFNKSYDKDIFYPVFEIVAWTNGYEREEVKPSVPGPDRDRLAANVLD
jgi:hypothetical protein